MSPDNNSHIIKSYISPKIHLKRSSIHGIGMFAKEYIYKGEVVFIKCGHILLKEDVFSTNVINSYMQLSDELFIGATSKKEEETIKLYNNHSCDPNCGVRGEITFVAIKDIAPGEELTIDYAFVDNENYSFVCNCGSNKCRKRITGFDWKIKELQDQYYPYFSCYLQSKISCDRDNRDTISFNKN